MRLQEVRKLIMWERLHWLGLKRLAQNAPIDQPFDAAAGDSF